MEESRSPPQSDASTLRVSVVVFRLDTRFYSSPRGEDPGSGDIYPCGAGFQGCERPLIKFQRSPFSEKDVGGQF
ncbi:uncharacterized [Tachysurus ichikawai]